MKKILFVLIVVLSVSQANDICKNPQVVKLLDKTISALPITIDQVTKVTSFKCANSRYYYGLEVDAVKGDYLEKDLEQFYKKYQKYADSVSVQTQGAIKATYTIMYRDGEIMKAIYGN